MANDINRVVIIGRLTKDVELRYTQGGSPVANFSVACNKSYTKDNVKKDMTSFLPVIAWNKLGEVVAQYCHKGDRIAIDGRLQQRSWDDSDGKKHYAVEIIAENVEFLQNKPNSDSPPPPASKAETPPAAAEDENPFSGEDDIPF